MRVIAGKYRGIRLTPPKDNSVRPTTDRIKETVFNILMSRYSVEGEDVLDLFSGSGALGIEAASRGASDVVFVDASAESVRLTKENIRKIKQSYFVLHGDFKFAAKKFSGKKFGVIFVDPPYKAGLYAEVFSAIREYDLLKKDGVIVAEHGGDVKIGENESFFTVDTRKCGNTYVGFYVPKEA